MQQIIKLPNLPKTSLELSKAILAYGIKISVKSWLDYCDTNQINPSAHIASWLPNLKLDFAGVVQLLNRGVTEQQIYEYQRKNKNDFIDMPDEKNKLAQLIKDGQADAKHIAVLTRLFIGAGSEAQRFNELKDFVSQTQISEPETLGKLINSLALSDCCNQNAEAVIGVIRSTKMPKTAANLASFVNHLKITNVDVISQIVKECLDIKNPIENNSDLFAGAIIEFIRSTKMPKTAADLASFVNHLKITNIAVISQIVKECLDINNQIEKNLTSFAVAVTEFIGNTNIPRATDGLAPFIARSFVDDDNLNQFIDGIGLTNGQKEKLRTEIATMQQGSVENNQTNNVHNEISTYRRQPNVYDAITDKDL